MSDLRAILHQVVDAIVDRLEAPLLAGASDDYYDQDTSPLSRVVHMRLVRSGALPGSVCHRQYLVLKSDMHAYIKRHRVQLGQAEQEADGALPSEEDAVASAIARLKKAG